VGEDLHHDEECAHSEVHCQVPWFRALFGDNRCSNSTFHEKRGGRLTRGGCIEFSTCLCRHMGRALSCTGLFWPSLFYFPSTGRVTRRGWGHSTDWPGPGRGRVRSNCPTGHMNRSGAAQLMMLAVKANFSSTSGAPARALTSTCGPTLTIRPVQSAATGASQHAVFPARFLAGLKATGFKSWPERHLLWRLSH